MYNMYKLIPVIPAIVLFSSLVGTGCEEEPVGAPCRPETDKGTFNKSLRGNTVTVSVETGSVQCETSICLTYTRKYADPDSDAPNEYEKYESTQFKHSFCSCRCRDAEGHKYDKNSDKYDDLCECPPNTLCESVLGNNIEKAPEKIKGSYCIPKCIVVPDQCVGEEGYVPCVPSNNSDEPWDWHCDY